MFIFFSPSESLLRAKGGRREEGRGEEKGRRKRVGKVEERKGREG